MLIPFFLGVIVGVVAQVQQPHLWQATWYMACTVIGLALLCWMGIQSRYRFKIIVLLAAAIFSFGTTGWRAVQYAKDALNPALEGVDMEVVGVVTAMPQRLDTGLRFRINVEAAHVADKPVQLPSHVFLSWYRGHFNDDETAFDLERSTRQPRAGERWQFTVRLKAPHGNSNPYGFDYELWLWEQGVGATGYVRENKHQTPPRLLGQVQWHAGYAVERARQTVRDQVFLRLGRMNGEVAPVSNMGTHDRASAGVLAALITGDQNAIERADWDVFRATGVAHLMSISGLHITMFAWLAGLFVNWLWRRSARYTPSLCLRIPAIHAALICGLLLAALYAWFSGWGVPAQRTVCMLTTFTLLRLLGLRWPWYAAWSFAAVVVLVLDPWAILQAGFWLSFVAVAVLFASDSGGQESKWWSMLREQWTITLALTPLTLLLFQQVSLVGLVANALAIPVVTLVVTPLAILGVAFHSLWDAAGQMVVWLSIPLKWLAAQPFAVYSAPAAPTLLGFLAVLGGVLLVLPLSMKKRLFVIPFALMLMLPAFLWQPTRPAAGQFELIALDIGQGNAVLIKTAHHSLLFDAGPRFSRESDAGHRTIVPLLRALGEKLDVLMLSHRDSDHIGGAKAVLAMQPQARVVTSALKTKDRIDMGLQTHTALEPCYAGQNWIWDGVRFDVLHPTEQAVQSERAVKPNAISCVLKITNGDASKPQSALLTADIEQPQEHSLKNMDLASTVLLVPHHGSKTSSSEAFIDAVSPKIALVQAGYRNRFAHPRPDVMARYEGRKIASYLSPSCGAMTWHSAVPDRVICQREADKRYWHHQP